ncbi:MAG TPA: CPCC family cysteine-rich protein [Pyrinomonadaceae bacterium]|nr:CPCC family cysteine-rich protein [Pyrinomonadaceae bacterium]
MTREFLTRRKFFDSYGALPNQQAAGVPPKGVRLTCPCCGFPMLGESAAYEICRLCSWEDDGQDTPNADEVWGGPNHGYSLSDARTNFDLYLAVYPPAQDTRIGGPDTQREKDIKSKIIAAFERMMEDPQPQELIALWQSVLENEESLYQELKRRIGALYEATPCPYCGATLRTRNAKQCRKCGRDWHDTENVIRLSFT